MSSYIVNDKTINRFLTWFENEVENGELRFSLKELAKQYEIDLTNIVWQAMLASAMFELNCRAFNTRYEDQEEQSPLLTFTYEPISLMDIDRIQALKSLKCWLYQCTEGDIPRENRLYLFLEEVSHYIAMDIVTDTSQYDKAEWG